MGAPSDRSERNDKILRLGCSEQAAIAEELRHYYQHVVDEGVPTHLQRSVLRFAEKTDRRENRSGRAAAQAAQNAAEPGVILLADFRRGDR